VNNNVAWKDLTPYLAYNVRLHMTHKRLLALCLLCLLLPDIALALPDVKVTLKVLDEAGLPVEGATATVNFQAGTEGNSESERTDSGGLATLTGSSTRFVE